jgi:hypothetical protein
LTLLEIGKVTKESITIGFAAAVSATSKVESSEADNIAGGASAAWYEAVYRACIYIYPGW